MISELSITDLGVISSARIEPHRGLTVITGETGAGKTMLLSALALILGGKAETAMIRPGAEHAAVEARLVVAPEHPSARIALDAGAMLDEDELLASRVVTSAGRSRAYLGGRSVPAGVLAEVGEALVTVHGQSDQVRLRSRSHQRAALDGFAGHAELVDAFAVAYRRHREAAAALQRWDSEADQRAQEVERLERAADRVAALDLAPGEDARLRAEAERLGNVEDLRIAAEAVQAALSGSDEPPAPPGALDLLQHVRRELLSAERFDPALGQWAAQVEEATHLLNDVALQAAEYVTALEADPRRLDEIHERRSALAGLAREYLEERDGDLADRLVGFAQEAHERLAELTAPGRGREALAGEVDAALAEVQDLAGQLSDGRSQAAAGLAQVVDAELAMLAMPQAHLEVRLTPRADLAEHGAEDIEFFLTPHPGAPARPLGKAASGGELSRVMLAVEVALATPSGRRVAEDRDALPTFVFDEVDAGVGGRAASEVGRRLAELARHTQVIVITHLAQVAAFADQHLVVTKHTDGVVTESDVAHVHGQAREAELARMLSGEVDSEHARRHAAELLTRPSVRR